MFDYYAPHCDPRAGHPGPGRVVLGGGRTALRGARPASKDPRTAPEPVDNSQDRAGEDVGGRPYADVTGTPGG